MKTCTSCNLKFDDSKNYCIECGKELIPLTEEKFDTKTVIPPKSPVEETNQNSLKNNLPQKKRRVNLTIIIALVIILAARFIFYLRPSFIIILIVIAAVIVFYQSSRNKKVR